MPNHSDIPPARKQTPLFPIGERQLPAKVWLVGGGGEMGGDTWVYCYIAARSGDDAIQQALERCDTGPDTLHDHPNMWVEAVPVLNGKLQQHDGVIHWDRPVNSDLVLLAEHSLLEWDAEIGWSARSTPRLSRTPADIDALSIVDHNLAKRGISGYKQLTPDQLKHADWNVDHDRNLEVGGV